MNIVEASKIAAQFLTNAEGFQSVAYKDSAGVWTNGFGNTNYVDGKSLPISWAEGITTLNQNILKAYDLLLKRINNTTKAALSNHQGAALISFVFNAGCGNWNIWNLLNKGQFDLIPNELLRFDHAHVDGKLVEVKGLKNRREAEIKLWRAADVALTVGIPLDNIASFAGTFTSPTPKVSVAPMPNPAKIEQSQKALVTTVAATSTGSVAIAGFHLAPQVLTGLLVGSIVTIVILLTIGVYLYFKKSVKSNLGEIEMAASQAMTDALSQLKSAYDAKVQAATDASAAEVTSLQGQIATLQQQLAVATQTEADDVAAVAAATPVQA